VSAQDAASAIQNALALLRAGCSALASDQLRKALEALKPMEEEWCPHCSGTGVDDDARYEACDGRRVRASRLAGAALAALVLFGVRVAPRAGRAGSRLAAGHQCDRHGAAPTSPARGGFSGRPRHLQTLLRKPLK
jgi:hypothetical protein